MQSFQKDASQNAHGGAIRHVLFPAIIRDCCTLVDVPSDASHDVGVDFDDGTGVRLLREEKVVRHTEHRHTPRHDTSPVHVYKVGAHLAWPEAEEDNEREVADRDDIVGNAPGTLQSPRTPGQATIVGFGNLRFVEDRQRGVRVVQVTAESSPEEETDCEEVGEVEAFED
jgi:hypothetical protein